jgi:acyl-CoA synthetase (AMP-forming)/AMP-acid ligase II
VPRKYDCKPQCQTEWVLLTSGTTGRPKLVSHTLESLAGAIDRSHSPDGPIIWSTFYDIRRYGGLQIFLRAVLTGKSLVLSDSKESTADFLLRAASHGVTHISGTPSQWRRALMSPAAHAFTPEYVRLSGEVADQSILKALQAFYPQARVAHAFASTEAGVAFEVNDSVAGFSASAIEKTPNVEMKVEDHTLRIRSARTARCYLGDHAPVLKGEDGFVDTGDMVELRDGRYYFVGRRDGIINVGGLKVYPEEVEAVINRHPEVHMSLVRAKKNPVTGSLVVADVVLSTAEVSASRDARSVQNDILLLCREALSTYKVPAIINFVPALAVAGSGKMIRQNA